MRYLFFAVVLFVSFNTFGQNELLAKNYFNQGRFDMALPLYERLYQNNPNHREYLLMLVATHQQLENFIEAETLLQAEVQKPRTTPALLIDLGRNYQLQNRDAEAKRYYDQALESLSEQPNYTHAIANAFIKYNLLDEAIAAYKTGAEQNPTFNFSNQLARLYGERGETEKMFGEYLNIIENRPTSLAVIQRNFNHFITENPDEPANQTLRRMLLTRSQENPETTIYNELLSWLFVQQKEPDKALVQEKAIYRRKGDNLESIFDLVEISIEDKHYDAAHDALDFVIEYGHTEESIIEAERFRIQIETETAPEKELEKVAGKYEALLEKYGDDLQTFDLQIDYSLFLAFRLNKPGPAVDRLKTLKEKRLSRILEAETLMAMADILVYDQKFNSALIHYSRVQNMLKNHPISQEARYKVAQASYFKGDFEWALTQLEVLKNSTSQLIANNAMELNLLINDNILFDSTHAALKMFARADLLDLQNRHGEAITVLDGILAQYRDDPIEDRALYKQARIFEKTGDHSRAVANYIEVIEQHSGDLMADKASFHLAQLYHHTLGQPEKAKPYYEKIIFEYPDSIYFTEARKQYRAIRGDVF